VTTVRTSLETSQVSLISGPRPNAGNQDPPLNYNGLHANNNQNQPHNASTGYIDRMQAVAAAPRLNDNQSGPGIRAHNPSRPYNLNNQYPPTNKHTLNYNQPATPHDTNGWAQTFFSLTLIAIFVGTVAVALLSFAHDTISPDSSSNTGDKAPSSRRTNDAVYGFWYLSELFALLSTMSFAVLGVFFGLTGHEPPLRPDNVTRKVATALRRLIWMGGISLLFSILCIIVGIVIFAWVDQTHAIRYLTFVAVVIVVIPLGIPVFSLLSVNTDFYNDSPLIIYLQKMER